MKVNGTNGVFHCDCSTDSANSSDEMLHSNVEPAGIVTNEYGNTGDYIITSLR